MDNTIFAAWVSGRLDFTDKDKRACFDTAKTIVEIVHDVRRNGILFLDEKIPAYEDSLLRLGLRLAVDSLHPDMIKEIMQTWVISGNYRGAELLRQLMIIDGLMAIVHGNSPGTVSYKLGAFFGEGLMQEYSEYGKTAAQ